MRITVQHALKIPAEEEYSSRQHSIAIELEPPPEVAQDKEKLRVYIDSMTAEVRQRVEQALGRPRPERQPASETTPARPSRTVPQGNGSQRTPPPRRPPAGSSTRPGTRSGRSNNGSVNGNGASLKQLNYLRSLASEAGYSADQLAYLAQEVVGKEDIRALSKGEASQMIDQLRSGGE
jgi:hypothetical protein